MIATLSLSSILGWAALAAAGPVVAPRVVDSLNEAATAEAHQRDNTATRAFSNVQIKTSDGRCLFVDKLSGDFRANLTPVQIGACGATDGQGWDIITAGKHINVANSILIVSTLTNACFNFDPRRAAGNQVLLFSCGGRADGGGEVTSSQLFAFSGGAGPLSLAPENEKGSCLTVKGNVLDIAKCNAGDAGQSFTLGGAAAGGNGGGGNNNNGGGATAGRAPPSSAARQEKPSATKAAAGSDASQTKCSGGVRTVTVTAPLEGRGGQFTRPSGGKAQEKPTGVALGAAIPDDIESTTSESPAESETKAPGKTKTRGRKKPTAAGSAAPSGTDAAATSPEIAQGAAVPESSSAAAASVTASGETKTRTRGGGRGKGKAATTRAAKGTTAETSQATAEAAATEASEAASTATSTEAASEATSAPTVAPTGKVAAIANPTTPVPVSRAGGTLQPSAAAQAHQRDAAATRAFSNVEIRAPNGQCLFIDPTAGDFRQNLIPVQLVDCSGTPNEKFDIITSGKHNNAQESALIVSSLTNGCVSFDGRRAQGDTVTLFSCGGRADGEGETNSGQLVRFIGALSFAVAPKSENGKTCVLPGNGRLESGPCPTDGAQLFSIFP